MSFFASGFDASKVEPATPFQPIPAGTYRVAVVKAECRPTKAPGGEGLSLEYVVVDGQYKGRKLFHWINVKNANKQAQEIGHRELSSVCRAVGIMQPKGAHQFIGKSFTVEVAIDRDTRDGKDQLKNVIKGVVLPAAAAGGPNGGTPVAATTQTVAAPQPVREASAPEAAPWG